MSTWSFGIKFLDRLSRADVDDGERVVFESDLFSRDLETCERGLYRIQ